MNDNLFIFDINNIPNNFVKLSVITTRVNGIHAFDNCPFFFKIDSYNQYRTQEKLSIYQVLNNQIIDDFTKNVSQITNYSKDICHKILFKFSYDLQEAVEFLFSNEEEDILRICEEIDLLNSNYAKIATFYNHYNYTRSIMYLLKDKISKKNFLFYINHENIAGYPRFTMNIHVFIDKKYLSSIYESPKVPCFLTNLTKYESRKKRVILSIPEVSDLKSNIELKKDYKREYYDYQKCNIVWMKELEESTTQNFKISSFLSYSKDSIYKINSIDDFLITDSKGNFIKPENMDQFDVIPNGGVLCDNIGLGKTSSMIGLINESLIEGEKPSLIICPTRLCKQWGDEIDTICDLKYKIISTVTQFRSLKKNQNLNDYHIIILSYSFITNLNYLKIVDSDPEDPYLLKNIQWKRVIMDEGHEYLSKKKSRKKLVLSTKNSIRSLNYDYIWLCSGTPFSCDNDFYEIINFLCDFKNVQETPDFSQICHISDKLIEYLFRKNTKNNLQNILFIPEPIITTDFLNQTQMEQAIYHSCLGDTEKMIQLCSHVLVSEEHINILGNIPLPMDQVYTKMTSYYKKKIDKLTTVISNQQRNLESLELLVEKSSSNKDNQENKDNFNKRKVKIECIKEKLIEWNSLKRQFTSKLNIFEKINVNELSKKDCPVCLCPLEDGMKVFFKCGHIFCSSCTTKMFLNKNEIACPCCRSTTQKDDLEIVKSTNLKDHDQNNKWGTKMSYLIQYLNKILESSDNRVILFSQWDNLLKLVGNVLDENKISHLFINGSLYVINSKIRKFKLDNSIKVVLLSSDKAVSGLNLTEANHIILLDTLNNDKETSRIIEEQAIGRAVRIGQKKIVKVKRLIMSDTIEHDFYVQNIDN